MALDPGSKLPTNLDELDVIAGKVYRQGVEAGKVTLRTDIREFLTKEFLNAKGRERRANPEDPKVQAIRAIMERLYEAFEEGTL